MKIFHLYILGFLVLMIITPSFSQSVWRGAGNFTIVRDSVMIDNRAIFVKYEYYDRQKEEDAVKFTLTIKNNSSHSIPDIQTARFKQTDGLKIWINGYDAMQMSLANGIFGEDKTLSKGKTDSWEMDIQITGRYKADFGDVFTWQWEYMQIKSPIIQVDLKNRTITEVTRHIKSDKVIY